MHWKKPTMHGEESEDNQIEDKVTVFDKDFAVDRLDAALNILEGMAAEQHHLHAEQMECIPDQIRP
jgi:hypothetical protein